MATPGGDQVGEAHVDIHVNAAPGEAELAAFRQKVDRDFDELGRKKAEAELKLKATEFDKKIEEAKKKLDYFKMRRERATLDLAKKHFDKEVAAAAAELKALGAQRTTIRLDTKQLREAHNAERLLAKERALSERAAIKQTNIERKNAEALRKTQFEVDKLRVAYNKLGSERRRLETKAGRPGGIFHTEAERLELRKLQSEMDLTAQRIQALGGDVDDIDVDFEDNRSILLRWGASLANTRLHLGFFSATLKQTAIGLIVLGPILTGLLGSLTSVVGVLGTGLAGASAIAAAGLSGLALSALGATAVIKPIIGEIKEASSASEAYHKAVLKYGKGSDEAVTAQEKLAGVLSGISPGARSAVEELGAVKDAFREAADEARPAVFEGYASSIKTIHALLPAFARESVNTTNVLSEGWQKLMENLRSDDAKNGIETIMRNFRIGLPPLLNGFESLGRLFGHVSVSASQFLPGLNQGFAEWARNLERSVGSGRELDTKISRLIEHMRDFGHFSQATARLLIALFNTSADSGDGLLETLTRIFNRWTDWMNSVEGQRSLREFFSDSKSETENLFAVLGKIVHLIWAMGRAFAPVADGALEALNMVGAIVEVATKFDPLMSVLREVGKLAAAVWAINRVQAFVTAVSAATRAMAGFGAVSAGAGAASAAGAVGAAGGGSRGREKALAGGTGAIAGVAAAEGAAAGRGLIGGITKAARIAGPAAMLLVGIELAEEVMDAFADRAKQRSDNIFEALEGAESTPAILGGIPIGKNSLLAKIIPDGEAEAAANVKAQLEQIQDERTRISAQTERALRLQLRELNITEDAKRSAKEMFALTRLGRKLDIKVSGANDPAQLQKLLRGYQLLRSGALASLGDIGKITERNAQIIRTQLPRGSEEARRKTADNFRAAADAIKKGMERGTINVKRGTEQWKNLLRNARLFEGRDPLGIAKGFAASWKDAGGINRRNRERMIDELAKMPPRARAQAFQAMLQYGRGLVRGKKIPEEDLRLFKSAALTELGGIGGGFSRLSSIVFDALANIGQNLKGALKGLGGEAPKFSLKLLPHVSELPKPSELLERQQGGFTVSGYGSGDKVPKRLPNESFVMNREATKAFELNRGGTVQTLLEPGERVFMPKEVRKIGPERLAAMNAAVPRQQGGPIGPMPLVVGRPSAAKDIGQGAIRHAYSAAEEFFNTQKKKFEAMGGMGGQAPLWGAIDALARKHGLVPGTLTGRLGEAGSWHGVMGPGGRARATDYSGPAKGMFGFSSQVAALYGRKLEELIYSPLGFSISDGRKVPPYAVADHYDHSHVAFMLGGLVQKLLAGGPVGAWDDLVGGYDAWDNRELATLAHIVGMANPAFMGQKAQGESSGNRKAVGHDPGGSIGRGLWQVTSGVGNESLINKWGGPDAMFHPYLNARVAEEIQEAGGAFYAPLRGSKESPDAQLADEMRAIIRGDSADTSKTSTMPKSVTATYDTYEVRNGSLTGIRHKDKVLVDIPTFGPIPKNEGAIKRELEHIEHELLPKYRAAAQQTKNKEAKKKLQEALRAIEKRIRELREALRSLRAEKARKRFKRRLQKELGRITGYEPHIEAAEREYEERDEYASQVVSQEPEQRGEITHEWLTNIFEPYVNEREAPAYTNVLASENTWRNTVLDAQDRAKQIERGWEMQIGWPQDGRKPWLENPNLYYPPRRGNIPTGLAEQIYIVNDVVENMQRFIHQHSGDAKWWNAHPNAKELRKQYQRELPGRRNQLKDFKFKRSALTEALGEGRESFDYARGTGSFEDSMINVQGRHWPDQHERIDTLPSLPVPGMYGGAIWDTQEAIKGLGLKIEEARESISGGTDDKAAELKAFEDAIHSLLAGRPFLSINHEPLVGAFASGGMVPRAGYALVGERGPELAYLPGGTHITNNERTREVLGSSSVTNVTNNFAAPPPDPHTWAKQQRFELGAIA